MRNAPTFLLDDASAVNRESVDMIAKCEEHAFENAMDRSDPSVQRCLRVAFWVKIFPPRYESFILNQIQGMVRMGHDVTVIAMKKGTHSGLTKLSETDHRVAYRPPIPTHRLTRALKAVYLLGANGWRSPRAMMKLLSGKDGSSSAGPTQLLYDALPFFQNRKFDVLHCQYGTLGIAAANLKCRGILQSEIITSFRGFDLSRVVSRQDESPYRRLFETGSRFLPVCKTFARRLERLGCPADRIQVLPSGIEVEKFAYQTRTLEPGAMLRILSIGRLVEKKGLEFGIRSVAALIERGYSLNYDILGDGPLAGSLQSLCRELGVSDRVAFRGWQPPEQVRRSLGRAHLFLAPSATAWEGSQEGIPNTIKEAMACGLPVVATRHGGIPELVQDGITGLLAPEGDADALAECIIQLIQQADRWPMMGQAARDLVRQNYDADRVNRQLNDLYAQVVGTADPIAEGSNRPLSATPISQEPGP